MMGNKKDSKKNSCPSVSQDQTTAEDIMCKSIQQDIYCLRYWCTKLLLQKYETLYTVHYILSIVISYVKLFIVSKSQDSGSHLFVKVIMS